MLFDFDSFPGDLPTGAFLEAMTAEFLVHEPTHARLLREQLYRLTS